METLCRYVETRPRCRRAVRDGEAELAFLHPGATEGNKGLSNIQQSHTRTTALPSSLLPTISSNLIIISVLQWRKLRLGEVTQLINDAGQNQTQSLWLQNLHSFHYLMLLCRMESWGRTLCRRQKKWLVGQKTIRGCDLMEAKRR